MRSPRLPAYSASRILIEFLRDKQEVSFIARGGSMWPSVRDGATLSIKPVKLDSLRVGDLAAVERRGALVVHRVIARTATRVILRGDSLASPDGAFTADKVLGIATVRRQPRLGLVVPTFRHVLALGRWAARALGLNASRAQEHPSASTP